MSERHVCLQIAVRLGLDHWHTEPYNPHSYPSCVYQVLCAAAVLLDGFCVDTSLYYLMITLRLEDGVFFFDLLGLNVARTLSVTLQLTQPPLRGIIRLGGVMAHTSGEYRE